MTPDQDFRNIAYNLETQILVGPMLQTLPHSIENLIQSITDALISVSSHPAYIKRAKNGRDPVKRRLAYLADERLEDVGRQITAYASGQRTDFLSAENQGIGKGVRVRVRVRVRPPFAQDPVGFDKNVPGFRDRMIRLGAFVRGLRTDLGSNHFVSYAFLSEPDAGLRHIYIELNATANEAIHLCYATAQWYSAGAGVFNSYRSVVRYEHLDVLFVKHVDDYVNRRGGGADPEKALRHIDGLLQKTSSITGRRVDSYVEQSRKRLQTHVTARSACASVLPRPGVAVRMNAAREVRTVYAKTPGDRVLDGRRRGRE